MNILQKKIRQTAVLQPYKIAIQGDDIVLNYSTLLDEIDSVNASILSLCHADRCTFAVLLDNHPSWAVLDLALLFNKQCAVPLPHFFSIEQLQHALLNSQADYMFIEEAEHNVQLIEALQNMISSQDSIQITNKKLLLLHLKSNSFSPESTYKVNQNIVKITYTSGTTDKPKGVLLSGSAIMAKTTSLAIAIEPRENDVCLSVLPLSTLLENIGGLYVPLLCGATSLIVSAETIGLSGSSLINHDKLLSSIQHYRPAAFIIIPQLLLLLVNAYSNGYRLPDSVRFIAMGGAPISRKILNLAKQFHIPVYEGYGLSEAASVVAVNNAAENRIGSVGKILHNHRVKIDNEGEILIKNDLFDGYLGQPKRFTDYYATGDIGYMDKDDFLYITGRRKNIINTSFGRNISPEWIEKELEAFPMVAQCVVYGHAKPCLMAIIVLRSSQEYTTTAGNRLATMLETLNVRLPDYARVKDFILTDEPFGIVNNQLTGTGRPRRMAIYKAYKHQLDKLYEPLLSA